MASSSTVRNLRDGQIVIKDGTVSGGPLTSAALCDTGDLRWSMPEETNLIRCRGVLVGQRDGDAQPLELSFSTKWSQLINYTTDSSESHVIYEMVENIGSTYTSTAAGKYCLDYEFTVADPAGGTLTGEKIVFNDVYKTNLQCGEGDEFNTIEFTGGSISSPTITRV